MELTPDKQVQFSVLRKIESFLMPVIDAMTFRNLSVVNVPTQHCCYVAIDPVSSMVAVCWHNPEIHFYNLETDQHVSTIQVPIIPGSLRYHNHTCVFTRGGDIGTCTSGGFYAIKHVYSYLFPGSRFYIEGNRVVDLEKTMPTRVLKNPNVPLTHVIPPNVLANTVENIKITVDGSAILVVKSGVDYDAFDLLTGTQFSHHFHNMMTNAGIVPMSQSKFCAYTSTFISEWDDFQIFIIDAHFSTVKMIREYYSIRDLIYDESTDGLIIQHKSIGFAMFRLDISLIKADGSSVWTRELGILQILTPIANSSMFAVNMTPHHAHVFDVKTGNVMFVTEPILGPAVTLSSFNRMLVCFKDGTLRNTLLTRLWHPSLFHFQRGYERNSVRAFFRAARRKPICEDLALTIMEFLGTP